MQHGSRTHARRRLFVRTTRAVTAASAAAFALAGAGPAPAGTLDPDRAAGLEIVDGPSPYWPAGSATVTWIDDDPEATFECSLDGASFQSCTSPAALDGMTERAYAFRVRALHEDEEAEEESLAWTVDLTAPSAPAFTAIVATQTSIVVDWTAASDAGPVLGYVAYLNGLARTGTVAARTFRFTNLTCGPYTVGVEAVDAAGNVSPRTTHSAGTTCLAQAPRCVVPNVVGRSLLRATALLAEANCRRGTVTRGYSASPRGRVLHQSRRPDQTLLLGTRIDLVVSRGPRP